MKSIKLRCQTLGFQYGSIVEVNKDISEDEAKALVDEGLATVHEANKDISEDEAKKGKANGKNKA